MPRRHERKTGIAVVAVVRDKDIPAWVRDVPIPEGIDLRRLLNCLRTDFTPFDGEPEASFLDALAETAHHLWIAAGRDPTPAIELLDLVPAYLSRADRYPWLLEALRVMFTARAYEQVATLKRRLGKLGSDQHMVRGGLYALARQQGMAHDEALRWVGSTDSSVTKAAIQKSVERWRKRLRDLGAKPQGGGEADLNPPCRCEARVATISASMAATTLGVPVEELAAHLGPGAKVVDGNVTVPGTEVAHRHCEECDVAVEVGNPFLAACTGLHVVCEPDAGDEHDLERLRSLLDHERDSPEYFRPGVVAVLCDHCWQELRAGLAAPPDAEAGDK